MRGIRYAVRSLLSTPVVTVTALLVLALGIGATTAIFSVANSVLFRPLPFAEPERLVVLGTVGILEFQAYRQQGASFDALVAYSAINKNFQGTGDPERIAAVSAERGLFDLLAVRPMAGRTFTSTDPPNVAVVAERFWRERFGAPSLLDWKVVLDGEPYTVIGVMPESFQFPYRVTPTDVWIPFDLPRTANPFQRIDVAIGRLKRGVAIEVAASELETMATRLGSQARTAARPAQTMIPLAEEVTGRSRRGLLTLLGAVGVVLLIACANVANLQLARGEARTREVAVRTALGATRGQLLRQFLTESVVLALAASAAALFVAIGAMRVLVAFAGSEIPRGFEIGLDWTTFVFMLTTGAATGVAFGIVPALRAITSDAGVLLSARAVRSSRGREALGIARALVVGEIALAFILVAAAGLLLRAFVHLEQTSTGIASGHVLTLRIETRGLLPPDSPSAATTAATSPQGRYYRAIEDRVMQIPGVRAAGFVTRLPVQSPGFTATFRIVGRPQPSNGAAGAPVRLREASPGYFRALGIALRAGRMFTDQDTGIIVNEALVRQHFAGENPIGRVLDRGTILGVVADVRQRLRLPAEPEIYSPLAATGYSSASLVVDAVTPPSTLVGPVRAAVREINPRQTVFDVQTMEDVVAAAHVDVDQFLGLIGAFAGLAFVLSMGGIYGVMSHAVAARRREFGIRLALGADPRRLMRAVIAQGGLLAGTGVIIGIAGALAVTRVLGSVLYEVTPTDPPTFLAATLLLAGVAMAACLHPALSTMRVDPAAVLREE